MKRYTKVVTIGLAVLLTVFAVPAKALTSKYIIPIKSQSEIPEGYIGIYSGQDLANINSDLSGKYMLMNDIDLSLFSNWTPLGTDGNFSGIFDGNGYTISNMHVLVTSEATNTVHVGLFANIYGAKIHNLNISNATVEVEAEKCNVGFLVGNGRDAEIKNCTIGASKMNVVGNMIYAGGIMGKSGDFVTIGSCINNGLISADSSSSNHSCVGGFLGKGSITTSITKSMNCGNINAKADGAISVGGISGHGGDISECANIATISVAGNKEIDANGNYIGTGDYYVGGIIGEGSSIIKNCYNSGDIEVTGKVSNTGNGKTRVSVCIGGILGQGGNGGGKILYSYNKGSVNGKAIVNASNVANTRIEEYIGSVAGNLFTSFNNFVVESCYSNYESKPLFGREIDDNKRFEVKNNAMLSSDEMLERKSFVGFDFEKTWNMGGNSDPGPVLIVLGNYAYPISFPVGENSNTQYEYIYDAQDLGENITLPVEKLDTVTDLNTASGVVNGLTSIMTTEQKNSATGIDLATLYAETAVSKAARKAVSGKEVIINKAAVTDLEAVAAQTSSAVETALVNGGVTTARLVSNTVTLTTDETGEITIKIDPDILTTQVDKIRVETPTYAITLKVDDLEEDLASGIITISSEDVGSGFAPGNQNKKTTVKVNLPKGKTTNPVTLSLPKDGGDTTYQAVVKTDGSATSSKYNPATTTMDGKVNTSGSYTVQTNQKDFTDIANKSAEMQKAIRYLASKGIINGTSATEFSPDGSINRAEIAALLVRALGKLDSSAANSFTDVTNSDWYYSSAGSSQKAKLINGYEDGTFRGTTTIAKDQILAVSARVLKNEMGYKEPSAPSSYLSKYSDMVAVWAQPEIALATKENLVVYRYDGTFKGGSNMTRGDAAIIIYRLFQKIW